MIIKVGLRLLPKLSELDFVKLKDLGFQIFVDAKLHDIPTQVAEAVECWADLGADYLTVHLSGGSRMLKMAHEVAKKKKITLLGVSVLTSLHTEDLKEMGLNSDLPTQVHTLIQLGTACGLNAFVCSAEEVSMLRKSFPQATFVCPGIHLDDSNPSPDQRRSVSLSNALTMGIDMPVIGRAIFKSANPRELSKSILERMNAVS